MAVRGVTISAYKKVIVSNNVPNVCCLSWPKNSLIQYRFKYRPCYRYSPQDMRGSSFLLLITNTVGPAKGVCICLSAWSSTSPQDSTLCHERSVWCTRVRSYIILFPTNTFLVIARSWDAVSGQLTHPLIDTVWWAHNGFHFAIIRYRGIKK